MGWVDLLHRPISFTLQKQRHTSNIKENNNQWQLTLHTHAQKITDPGDKHNLGRTLSLDTTQPEAQRDLSKAQRDLNRKMSTCLPLITPSLHFCCLIRTHSAAYSETCSCDHLHSVYSETTSLSCPNSITKRPPLFFLLA